MAESPWTCVGHQRGGGPLPQECPRWTRCSVPVCPLDPDWARRRMLGNEPVCFFLTEAQKLNGQAVFEERRLGWLYRVMLEATPALSSRWRRIKSGLERSAGNGSRMQTRPPTKVRHG